MLKRLINRRAEVCRMLHKKSEGAAHLAAVIYLDAIKIVVMKLRKKKLRNWNVLWYGIGTRKRRKPFPGLWEDKA